MLCDVNVSLFCVYWLAHGPLQYMQCQNMQTI